MWQNRRNIKRIWGAKYHFKITLAPLRSGGTFGWSCKRATCWEKWEATQLRRASEHPQIWPRKKNFFFEREEEKTHHIFWKRLYLFIWVFNSCWRIRSILYKILVEVFLLETGHFQFKRFSFPHYISVFFMSKIFTWLIAISLTQKLPC